MIGFIVQSSKFKGAGKIKSDILNCMDLKKFLHFLREGGIISSKGIEDGKVYSAKATTKESKRIAK